MEVANGALARAPSSVQWHERLAQIATWNNEQKIALDTYFWLAQTTNKEEFWQQVLRLAPGLHDDHALRVALRREAEREPSLALVDRKQQLEWTDKYIAFEERLAEPGAALAFLATHANGVLRQPLLERQAALAERAGDDELALQTWQTLDAEFGPDVAYAVRIVKITYAAGRLSDSLAVLERAKRAAAATSSTSGNDDFWRLYVSLNERAQRSQAVVEGSSHLLKGGREQPQDLYRMIAALEKDPLDAGRVAEFAYQRDKNIQSLRRAIEYYLQAQAFGRISALLGTMTADERGVAERDPSFLLLRARYWRHAHEPSMALEDVRQALRLAPESADARVALVWLLNEQGSDAELRAALNAFGAHAAAEPALSGAYAAAYLRLGDARRALRYLRLVATRDDPLWRLSAADALESDGDFNAAWRVRRSVWVSLQQQQRKSAWPSDYTFDQRQLLRARFVGLADRFGEGDASRQLLVELLREDNQSDAPPAEQAASQLGDLSMLPPATAADLTHRAKSYSAAARDAVLAWSQSHGDYDFQREWLAWQYSKRLAEPSHAKIAIAMADNDTAEIARLLDESSVTLPQQTRIAAERQAGRTSAAQTDAFVANDLVPDNDELHTVLVNLLLPSAQGVAPSFRAVDEGDLKFLEGSLGAGMRLTSTLAFALRYVERWQKGDDSLPGVPQHDRQLEAILRRQGTDDREALAIGRRDGLGDLTTARFDGSLFDSRALRLTYAVGYNQEATETQQLRVGGVKDLATLAVSFSPDPHIFARARAEYDRFYGQDRSYLGHGALFSVEAGYKLRVQYPDYTVRVVVSHGQYSATGTPGESLDVLIPSGETPSAQLFMPETFTQAAVLIGFGNGLTDGYTRAWRPFLEGGPLRDSRAGWGGRVIAGLAGSVFGADQLFIYVSYSTASQSLSTPVTEGGIRYRWIF